MEVQDTSLEIIAHRGASYDAPENTLDAVALAWEQGADAVEIDCRMTRDGRIVMIHDADTLRTSGERLVVAEATYNELRQLDVGRWKGEVWSGARIDTIDEVFRTIPHGKRLFVEVKCGREINDTLVEAIRASELPMQSFAVISYDVSVAEGVKRSLPEVAAYLVARFEFDELKGWSPTVDELIRVARDAGLDGIDVQARDCVDAAFVATARDSNLATYVWTVDEPDEVRRLIDAGVLGVTTNRPGWLRKQLAN
ncbi:MAG: hypothetical protein MI757_08255 [Pirellulales bacterium]|nr:hypothetical protein [Pirellulales bacterium]